MAKTYYYERHEDGKRVEETIHVYDFIKLLIKHIPDKNFKVVKYFWVKNTSRYFLTCPHHFIV